MYGVIGIIGRDFSSRDFEDKLFILGFQLNYMTVVVPLLELHSNLPNKSMGQIRAKILG